MINRIIDFSIRWRLFVLLLAVLLVAFGLRAALELPIDAVPDVTTNQVQINAEAPAFTPLEVEQYVTIPVELAMSSVPEKEEIRSISRFGLSQVTITFREGTDIYWARQVVLERLLEADEDLPPGVSTEMAPISTGLGEIYQFTLEAEPEAHTEYTPRELRTILDWTIKPRLRTVPGTIEVNSFGGEEKQYEVLVDPARLISYGLTLGQVFEALERNNSNVGGAYLERRGEQQLIRGVGLLQSIEDVGNVVVAADGGTPVYVTDVAEVGIGSQIRHGAATRDGRETVMGMAMLLKGENSRTVAEAVRLKLAEIQETLPPGVRIDTFHDRSELVNRTIDTATTNLVEGGVLVMLVLFLFLLQFRAGLIVSSAIPLSMLVAIIAMREFEISANLMSLGAIDFGLIVDAAVIIVENCVRRLAQRRQELGRRLTGEERRQTIREGTVEVRRASQFGEIIIIAAYIPIVSLVGMEGTMFRPMALTVIFALSGALVLSLTVIPALSAVFLRDPRHAGRSEENPLVAWIGRFYRPLLERAVRYPSTVATGAAVIFVSSLLLTPLLGSEFLPELEEGSIAVNMVRLPSVALDEAIRMTTAAERALLEFPEVESVVSRIGRPAIATDPMGTDMGDTYVLMKPPSEWTTAATRQEMVEVFEERLHRIPGMAYSFSQPIRFRMMELVEGIGARSDVVVKVQGEDLETLQETAAGVGGILQQIPGAADVRVQQTDGLPLLQIVIDRAAIARYGLNTADVQDVVRTAIAGTQVSEILEGSRRFALVVRLTPAARADAEAFGTLPVGAPSGLQIPLRQLARIEEVEAPAVIGRENGLRSISVEANVRGRDIGTFVAEAQAAVDEELTVPVGYGMTWGGMWENLDSGRRRLALVVPVTFFIIFLLLFATFNSLKQAALIFTGIPFAVTGGILALLIRDMNLSMSAGIGFVAVSGVAVLNGVVLVTFINQLRERGAAVEDAVVRGSLTRLRPVLMTALVATLGFVPMALSTSAGAEVQRPLATVVIGGLVTSTLLTLMVLPALYTWAHEKQGKAFSEPEM